MSLFLDYILNLFSYLNSITGVFVFIIIYIFSVIFLLPASWLSLVAGFLYGAYRGSFIVFISAFCAASISFFISKRFFYERIENIVNNFPKLFLLKKVIQKGGVKLIILTRLSPLFPFSILNYFYGLNNIRYRDFALGLLCILPGTFLYCSLGRLANNFEDIKNLRFDNNIISSLVSIISTALIIYLVTKYANEIIEESEHN